MKIIIATIIAALTLTATAAAQRSSPSNYTISPPTAGDLHSAWTNPEWKTTLCDQVVVTYRVAVPFDEMVRKASMGGCSAGKQEHDETGLAPGLYSVVLSTGFTGEWHSAPTGFSGPSLDAVPPLEAGPVEVR